MFSDNNEDSLMDIGIQKFIVVEKQMAIKTSGATTGRELPPKSEEPYLLLGRR